MECIMPSDASCEDIEVDKSLSFLNGFVQKSLEKGARPYIPENERSGMVAMNTFRNHGQIESSSHALRFEAYDLPKPAVPANPPVLLTSSADPISVQESSQPKVFHQTSLVLSSFDSIPGDSRLKLRLDGVQKKWGRPTYSSPAPSSSASYIQRTANGATDSSGADTVGFQARDTSYDSRKQQVEVSAEKQKLAASLFGGGSSKNEKSRSLSSQKSKVTTPNPEKPTPPASTQHTIEQSAPQPPPDLLDLGEPTITVRSAPPVDPFQQLEGLLESTLVSSSDTPVAAKAPKTNDLMGLLDAPSVGPSASVLNSTLADLHSTTVQSEPPAATNINSYPGGNSVVMKKGPNPQDSVEKDAVARQVGVTPSGRNPNLFRDLLG